MCLQTQEDEYNVFLKGRAELIVEVETLMSKKQMLEYSLMPPYLHMLQPVQRAVHRGDTVMSRLERLEAMFTEFADNMTNFMRIMGYGKGVHGGIGSKGLPAPGLDQGLAHGVGPGGIGAAPPGMMMTMGPNGEPILVQADFNMTAGQSELLSLQAQQLKESESQLPAILRQIDRLQRTVNNQEMRMEGMVAVLRDIENLLRNQQPVVVTQDRPQPRRGAALSEAELEKEVKRLLGKSGDAGKL